MRKGLVLLLATALGVAGTPVRKGADVWQGVIPPLRTFSIQDGPTNMTVYFVTEDRAGRLWVGTQEGSALYNGKSWIPLSLPKESASQFIRCLAETPDGSRWFGTEGAGLWRLLEGRWSQFQPSNGFPSNTVNFLTETSDGRGGWILWASTATGGIARFDGKAWTTTNIASGLPSNATWKVRELANPDGTKTLWAVTTKGFATFQQGRWLALGAGEGWPEGEANDIAQVLRPGQPREYWLSFWGKGLFRGDGKSWENFLPERGNFPSAFPVQLLVRTDQHGAPMVWASTYDKGLAWLSEGGWRYLDTHRGLPANGVYFIHAPSIGRPTVWLGMRGGGLAGLDLGGWYHAGLGTGLPANEIHAFAETLEPERGHTLWVGTSEGLAHWEQGRWAVDTTREGLPSAHITSLLAMNTKSGHELWAGTMKGLARRSSAGRWETVFQTMGLKDPRILCLQEGLDEKGTRVVWAGTEKGLLRFGPGGQSFFTKEDGLPDNRVFSLCRTLEPGGGESLWVGTRGGGIGRLRGGKWTHYQEAQGLKNLSVFCFRETRSADGKRWLWAGTFGGGVVRLSLDDPGATRWEAFTTDTLPGLPSNVVVRIEVDANGRLYFATQRGVARVSFQNPLTPSRPEKVQTFTTGDGLSSVACNYGASIIDHAGRVWVSTHLGAAVLNPALELPPPYLPSLILDQASVQGRPIHLDPKGIVLGHRDNQLTFEVSLPSFYREEEILYRSQLQGLEPQPSAWSTTARREMAAIPAGTYTLRLEAQDHLGRLAQPLAFPIQVRPAPWRSLWARAAYAVIIGGGLALSYRLRTSLLRNRNLELEARIRHATLELQDKNRALEHLNEEKNQFMGIAAHDLKNPLNAVVLASQQIAMGDMEPEEQLHFARMIEKAARQMADLIKNMLDVNRMDTGQMQLNIKPVVLSDLVAETCEAYLSLAQAKRQRLIVEAGRNVMALGDRLHLRDVLENFLSNAIKFTPPGPPARDIVVRAFVDGERSILEVEDGGPGFTEQDRKKLFGRFERLSARPTGGEGSSGLGLSIVKRLVEAMGGTITLESEPGRGATFRVCRPQPPPPSAPPV
jgi:signal transduction histidine kinase/ligand-binding sensor domain-containing protein